MGRLRLRRRHAEPADHPPSVDEHSEPSPSDVAADAPADASEPARIEPEPATFDDGSEPVHSHDAPWVCADQSEAIPDADVPGTPVDEPGWPRPGEFVMSAAGLAALADQQVQATRTDVDHWPDVRHPESGSELQPAASHDEPSPAEWSTEDWTDDSQPPAEVADWATPDGEVAAWHEAPAVAEDDVAWVDGDHVWSADEVPVAAWNAQEDGWTQESAIGTGPAAVPPWQPSQDPELGSDTWHIPDAESVPENPQAEWVAVPTEVTRPDENHALAELTAAVVALTDHVAELSRTVAELRSRLDEPPTPRTVPPAKRPTTRATPTPKRAAPSPARSPAPRTAAPFKLRVTEERELRAIAARRSEADATRRRARIILQSARGTEAVRIAERVGVSVATVRRWQERFRTERMACIR